MRADCFYLMRQQLLRVARMLGIPIILLALSSTAWAQIEPALPGSVEYSLLSNNQSWIETANPIDIGSYVEDLLTGRLNQPDGRGYIGIVTGTGFDQDYNEMAATVDFGRNYSVGIVFSELTAVQIVPEPSTLLLLPGALFVRSGSEAPARIADVDRRLKFVVRRLGSSLGGYPSHSRILEDGLSKTSNPSCDFLHSGTQGKRTM